MCILFSCLLILYSFILQCQIPWQCARSLLKISSIFAQMTRKIIFLVTWVGVLPFYLGSYTMREILRYRLICLLFVIISSNSYRTLAVIFFIFDNWKFSDDNYERYLALIWYYTSNNLMFSLKFSQYHNMYSRRIECFSLLWRIFHLLD